MPLSLPDFLSRKPPPRLTARSLLTYWAATWVAAFGCGVAGELAYSVCVHGRIGLSIGLGWPAFYATVGIAALALRASRSRTSPDGRWRGSGDGRSDPRPAGRR
jgi:hypothetical protein